MPKLRSTRSSSVPHVHTGCNLCSDFAGMCDLHTDCAECIKQGLDKIFTLENWKVQCQKALDVADYERNKGKDWQNMAARQSVRLAEANTRIKSLENTQGMLERQLRKANAQIEKSRVAYSVQCAEISRWKQHVLELKEERSLNSDIIKQIVHDARQIDGMQAILDRSITVDPTENLMHLFNAVGSEYSASGPADEEVV